MLHRAPEAGDLQAGLQLAGLRYVTNSRAAAAALAEHYTGLPIGG